MSAYQADEAPGLQEFTPYLVTTPTCSAVELNPNAPLEISILIPERESSGEKTCNGFS